MGKPRKCLSQAALEMISNVLGDTCTGLTGSQIGYFLAQSKIVDVYPMMTKRHRLYNALVTDQNKYRCSNHSLNFIAAVLNPARYVDNIEEFERLREAVNIQLAFVGYELQENGRYREVEKVNTISEAQQRVDSLKRELTNRKAHEALFKYCKTELLQNNYFHAVLEANKGLLQRIRNISCIETDGNTLIEQVFSDNPIVIINNYQTNSEKNEHKGFKNLLMGLCSMFRNPTAHEPKIDWEISEQDALDILGIISYCHRRLDKAHKIR